MQDNNPIHPITPFPSQKPLYPTPSPSTSSTDDRPLMTAPSRQNCFITAHHPLARAAEKNSCPKSSRSHFCVKHQSDRAPAQIDRHREPILWVYLVHASER